MNDKSHVTCEQKGCKVCGKTYDTGALLLDTRLRPRFDMYTVSGVGICPECTTKAEEYVPLIVVDESKSVVSNGHMKPEHAYRTGEVIHVRRTAYSKLFNTDVPEMAFIGQDVADRLRSVYEKTSV